MSLAKPVTCFIRKSVYDGEATTLSIPTGRFGFPDTLVYKILAQAFGTASLILGFMSSAYLDERLSPSSFRRHGNGIEGAIKRH